MLFGKSKVGALDLALRPKPKFVHFLLLYPSCHILTGLFPRINNIISKGGPFYYKNTFSTSLITRLLNKFNEEFFKAFFFILVKMFLLISRPFDMMRKRCESPVHALSFFFVLFLFSDWQPCLKVPVVFSQYF